MKKIAILGASEPHLPLFLKAKEMGLEAYCFAWNQGAYCKDYADHYYDISITDSTSVPKRTNKWDHFKRIRNRCSNCSICIKPSRFERHSL